MEASAPTAPRHSNRLAEESSPYLLQHAHNPVDWFPWGEEAFEEARRRQVPIFLSVGYSTCYWCHVMERESFEDEATGKLMSDLFVCIKVDREERPDVDDIYMSGVQLMTQRGGWPMSVFMTPPGARGPEDPGLEPFFGGTYFPRDNFQQLLRGIDKYWREQKSDALERSGAVAHAIRERMTGDFAPVVIGEDQIGVSVGQLMQMYDRTHGGFGQAPKFPQPVYLEFLLDALPLADDEETSTAIRTAVRHTLDRMAMGGMYDQVGGGFHRYSVDAIWLVPHFEKMLYDNGQLASLYARSYELFGDEFDARIVRETLDYVLREMTSADGAFFSAQDAEVDAHEGLNYLWKPAQFLQALGEDDAAFAASYYGLDRGPNFQDPHNQDAAPTNILFLGARPDIYATDAGLALEDLEAKVESIKDRLYSLRMQRKQPATDDKIIVGWNGLMIGGMADGAAALGDTKYLEAAERAADFIWDNMRIDGQLLRTSRESVSKTPAFLEDYAMFARGLVRLHRAAVVLERATPRHIERTREVIQMAKRYFYDADIGVWFDTQEGQSDLLVRSVSAYDGAVPCGQSVLINALLGLYDVTGEETVLDDAARLMQGMSRAIAMHPLSAVNSTRAIARFLEIDASLLAPEGADIADVSEALGNAAEEEPPVQIFANAERVNASKSAPESVFVELRIDEGWHITARNPYPADLPESERLPGLTGLDIRIDGGDGAAIEVSYPEGEKYQVDIEGVPPLMVYSGSVQLELKIVRTNEEWSGRPLILVTYQPCNDQQCLAPVTVELDVAIDPS